MRPVARALAPAALLLALALPALAPTAGAVSPLVHDFAPGTSAVAVRTDPSLVRCFSLRLDATLPPGGEFAMAAVYLMDGAGNLQFGEVHLARVTGTRVAYSVLATTPDGTQVVQGREGFSGSATVWTFTIDTEHCLPAARDQTTVFAAVTSKGVAAGRAVFQALDGDVWARQTVTGAATAYAAHQFDGLAAEERAVSRAAAHAVEKTLTVSGGLLGSFVTLDTAAVLTVEGNMAPRTQYEAGACFGPALGGCFALANTPTGTALLRGGAGAHTFRATGATAGDVAGTYLLAADIRLPLAAT